MSLFRLCMYCSPAGTLNNVSESNYNHSWACWPNYKSLQISLLICLVICFFLLHFSLPRTPLIFLQCSYPYLGWKIFTLEVCSFPLSECGEDIHPKFEVGNVWLYAVLLGAVIVIKQKRNCFLNVFLPSVLFLHLKNSIY